VRFSTFRVRCSRHFDILDIHFNDERRERLGQEDYERMEALAKEETLKKRFTEPAGAQQPFRGSGHRGGTAITVNIFPRVPSLPWTGQGQTRRLRIGTPPGHLGEQHFRVLLLAGNSLFCVYYSRLRRKEKNLCRFLNEASESTTTMVSLFESMMRWQRIICSSMGNLWAMAKKRVEVV